MSTGCPECAGEQMPGHPAGVLAIRHSNACQLRDAEDATGANDAETGERIRPATTAERTLLDALGYQVPAETYTQVTPITGGVRNRVHLVPGSPPGTAYQYPSTDPDLPPLKPITLKGTP